MSSTNTDNNNPLHGARKSIPNLKPSPNRTSVGLVDEDPEDELDKPGTIIKTKKVLRISRYSNPVLNEMCFFDQ